MPTVLEPTHPSVDPVEGDDPPRRITPGKVAVVVGSLGILLFWIVVWAVAGSYHPPGWLEDRAFPKAAEKLCASYTPRLEAIPLAQTATSSAARADLVDQATVILTERREALLAIVPATDDARFIREWLADWTQHLADRESYADQLRVKPGAEYLETTKQSSQISTVLDKFADDNNMASCDTFDDV